MILFILISIVGLDQVTKYLIQRSFALGDSLPLISGVLHITYHRNTGAAFGLFVGNTLFLAALSVIFIVVTARYLMRRPKDAPLAWALTLILSGAVGNVIDRLRLGYVVDFIDFRVWPIFNVADSAITCGVVLILWDLAASLRRSRHAAEGPRA